MRWPIYPSWFRNDLPKCGRIGTDSPTIVYCFVESVPIRNQCGESVPNRNTSLKSVANRYRFATLVANRYRFSHKMVCRAHIYAQLQPTIFLLLGISWTCRVPVCLSRSRCRSARVGGSSRRSSRRRRGLQERGSSRRRELRRKARERRPPSRRVLLPPRPSELPDKVPRRLLTIDKVPSRPLDAMCETRLIPPAPLPPPPSSPFCLTSSSLSPLADLSQWVCVHLRPCSLPFSFNKLIWIVTELICPREWNVECGSNREVQWIGRKVVWGESNVDKLARRSCSFTWKKLGTFKI